MRDAGADVPAFVGGLERVAAGKLGHGAIEARSERAGNQSAGEGRSRLTSGCILRETVRQVVALAMKRRNSNVSQGMGVSASR